MKFGVKSHLKFTPETKWSQKTKSPRKQIIFCAPHPQFSLFTACRPYRDKYSQIWGQLGGWSSTFVCDLKKCCSESHRHTWSLVSRVISSLHQKQNQVKKLNLQENKSFFAPLILNFHPLLPVDLPVVPSYLPVVIEWSDGEEHKMWFVFW